MIAGRILVTLGLIAAVGMASACGRKGDLDTPYDAAVQAQKDAQKAGQPAGLAPVKPVEAKPFIFDPLL